jgi:hypothetical protein
MQIGESEKSELRLPDFDDAPWHDKGYFRAQLIYMGQTYTLTFYDPGRLAQDIEAELETTGFFFEENLVIVREITREILESTARELVETGQVNQLVPSRE